MPLKASAAQSDSAPAIRKANERLLSFMFRSFRLPTFYHITAVCAILRAWTFQGQRSSSRYGNSAYTTGQAYVLPSFSRVVPFAAPGATTRRGLRLNQKFFSRSVSAFAAATAGIFRRTTCRLSQGPARNGRKSSAGAVGPFPSLLTSFLRTPTSSPPPAEASPFPAASRSCNRTSSRNWPTACMRSPPCIWPSKRPAMRRQPITRRSSRAWTSFFRISSIPILSPTEDGQEETPRRSTPISDG